MAITDELRHNIEGAEQLYGRECPRLRAIADRIDEEHKKAMDNSYRDGYQEGKRDGDDEWYEEHEAYLEEHGWYQALDADKEPIHIGDVMVDRGFPDAKYTVVGIGKDEFFTRDAYGELHEHTPSLYIHYKQPTVEDVLREFGKAWVEWEDGSPCDPIAEFAAKLRLASNEE